MGQKIKEKMRDSKEGMPTFKEWIFCIQEYVGCYSEVVTRKGVDDGACAKALNAHFDTRGTYDKVCAALLGEPEADRWCKMEYVAAREIEGAMHRYLASAGIESPILSPRIWINRFTKRFPALPSKDGTVPQKGNNIEDDADLLDLQGFVLPDCSCFFLAEDGDVIALLLREDGDDDIGLHEVLSTAQGTGGRIAETVGNDFLFKLFQMHDFCPISHWGPDEEYGIEGWESPLGGHIVIYVHSSLIKDDDDGDSNYGE